MGKTIDKLRDERLAELGTNRDRCKALHDLAYAMFEVQSSLKKSGESPFLIPLDTYRQVIFWGGSWQYAATELEKMLEEQDAMIASFKRGVEALEIQNRQYKAENARLQGELERIIEALMELNRINDEITTRVHRMKYGEQQDGTEAFEPKEEKGNTEA